MTSGTLTYLERHGTQYALLTGAATLLIGVVRLVSMIRGQGDQLS